MPAAAVIPAPIAYTKAAAVKKLVVDLSSRRVVHLPDATARTEHHAGPFLVHFIVCLEKAGAFTLKKLECSTQASRLNKLAWNNRTRPRFCSVGFWNTR